MQIDQVLNILCRHARPLILKEFREDSCIVSTAVAIDVLTLCGFAAMPVVCEVAVFNAACRKNIEKYGIPKDEGETVEKWEKMDGSWSVGIGFLHDKILKPNGWKGHLIAVGDTFMIDLSIDQASRPQRQINLAPFWMPWTAEVTFKKFMTEPCVLTHNECALSYRTRPTDHSFTVSPDWKFPVRRANIVGQIIERIKRAWL